MRTPVAALGLFVLALIVGASARGDDVLPQPAPAKRYEKLASHSPFAPPSAGPAPVTPVVAPPGPTWSENLAVTSLMQSHGVYTATVLEKNSSNKYFVRSDVENRESQLMIASVRWADRPEDIKVTLRKGTQFGDVHFEPAAGTSPGVAASGMLPPLNRPGAPNSSLVFHPPPILPPTGPAGGPGNAIVRGRPIHPTPMAGPPGLPGRPVINRQPNPVRPGLPGSPNKDDDDDDDN